MNPGLRLLIAILAVQCAACRADAGKPELCKSEFNPVTVVAPIIPIQLHVQVSGVIVASVMVEKDGSVTNPVIARAELVSLDRGKVSTSAYEQAVLTAAAQWRFPSSRSRCAREVTFEIQRSD